MVNATPALPDESFDEIKRWLLQHPRLRGAGPQMHDAFVMLAREAWRASGKQIVPDNIANSRQYCPFVRKLDRGKQGVPKNLADVITCSDGRIGIALKIPRDRLAGVDTRRATTLKQGHEQGHFQAFKRKTKVGPQPFTWLAANC